VRRVAERFAAVTITASLLTGCATSTTRAHPLPAAAGPLAHLDAAIAQLNAARSPALAQLGELAHTVEAADAADQAAAVGDRVAARSLVTNAAAGAARAEGLLRSARDSVGVYQQAVRGLVTASATAALSAQQRLALNGVSTDGSAEAQACRRAVSSYAAAWQPYAHLVADEQTWLTRSVAGWYRSPSEAAGAYAVLLDPVAESLAHVRSALSQAERERGAATTAMATALARASAALSALRAPA